jgi:exonuclease SbcD
VKILHTADWHVGRNIRGRSRADEHRAVLSEIAEIAARERVDAVLVVGDLFDTATPTAESENIVYAALLALAQTGATVVVLAGNHDSDRRLQAVAPLLELGHVVTRPLFAAPDAGGVVDLYSRNGKEHARLACVPFLSQRWVVKAHDLLDHDAATHQLQYSERMRMLVRALTAGFNDPSTIHLLAAHCMVLGATTTGSERMGQTVFEYALTAHAFPPGLQYVALGHLHRQQLVPGPVPIHYPGSPLQLDFGEVNDVKGVLLIDVHAGKPAQVQPIALRAGRRLRVIEAPLLALETSSLDTGDDWLKVIVAEQTRPGLADEVRQLLPNAVDVVIASSDAPRPERRQRTGRSPQELFAEFLADRSVDGAKLVPMFAEVLSEVMENSS